MEQYRCCVCSKLILEPELRRIGSRYFCLAHYERALRAAQSRWSRTGVIEVLLLVSFLALTSTLMGEGDRAVLSNSVPLGLVFALVPAAIWMGYLYRQDRIEPEPWSLIFAVFVLGALLAYATVRPLSLWLFRTSEWQHFSSLDNWVAVVGVEGFLQQLCVYLAVRYSVYLTDEFDEPSDGVVYAGAAGLGIATLSNFEFVVQSHGVLPLPGALAMASTALTRVAAAVTLGYGLGRGRFATRHGGLWIAGCLFASACVSGGLQRLAVVAGIDGAHFRPWVSLSVAAALATVTLLIVDILMAKHCRDNFHHGAVEGFSVPTELGDAVVSR